VDSAAFVLEDEDGGGDVIEGPVHAESAYRKQGFGSRIGFGARPALLIVDMQRDFVDPDAPTTCAPMAQERLPAIRTLLDAARTAGVPVFFSQGLVRPDLADIGLWKGPHGEGKVQIEDTPGAEIVAELAPLPGEAVVAKRRPSAFFRTELDGLLHDREVDTLILAGSSMSGCVRATAVDAFSRDYRTMVVRDCVIDRTEGLVESNLLDVDAKYGDAVSLDEALQYLSSRPSLRRSRAGGRIEAGTPSGAGSLKRGRTGTLKAETVLRAAWLMQDRFDRTLGGPAATWSAPAAVEGFSRFLASNLPVGRFRVTRGTVFDSRGEAVPSGAVLVADAAGSPSLPVGDGEELIPAEALFATVHVVPRLEADHLPAMLGEVAAIKGLHREPVVRGDDRVNDPGAAVVALEGLVEDPLLEALAAHNQSIPFDRQVDLVAVLGHGVATFVEVDPDGSITVELPLRPSARHRLSWMETGPATLFVLYLLLWETLRGRSLRWPSLHTVLRHVSEAPTRTLPTAHGFDRGE
jgi:maleamate amidohydrolase